MAEQIGQAVHADVKGEGYFREDSENYRRSYQTVDFLGELSSVPIEQVQGNPQNYLISKSGKLRKISRKIFVKTSG